MADTTDPYIAHPDGEQAYQAGLIAARERLAKIEAAMETPGYMPPAAQPTPAPIPTPQPAATPVPAPVPMPKPVQAPVTGFSLNALQNPVAPVSPVAQAFKEAESDPLAPIEEAPQVAIPAPAPALAPQPQPAPQPAPVPVPAPIPTPEPKPEAAPVPDIAAMIAAHKSVSPLSENAPASNQPTPAPLAQNPLQSPVQPVKPAKAPDHLKPVKTPDKPRSMPSRLRPILSAVIVFLVVLAAFKAPIFYYQLKYLFESPKTSQVASNSGQVSGTPTLTIPKINVSTPVVFEPSIVEANVQKALESGVVHYGNTAEPGKPGNAVIFGHSSNDWDKPGNFKFIFVLLEKLAVGDTFTVDYKGTRYEYQIYERKVVLATDVGVVAPTAEPTATLITCWPTGTSQKRLVVHAKQISPQPSSTAVATETPKLNTVGNTLPGADSNNGVTGTVTTWIENIRSAIKGEQVQVNGE
jgi:LPXTG-site transpeptidase (sortase) family protein